MFRARYKGIDHSFVDEQDSRRNITSGSQSFLALREQTNEFIASDALVGGRGVQDIKRLDAATFKVHAELLVLEQLLGEVFDAVRHKMSQYKAVKSHILHEVCAVLVLLDVKELELDFSQRVQALGSLILYRKYNHQDHLRTDATSYLCAVKLDAQDKADQKSNGTCDQKGSHVGASSSKNSTKQKTHRARHERCPCTNKRRLQLVNVLDALAVTRSAGWGGGSLGITHPLDCESQQEERQSGVDPPLCLLAKQLQRMQPK
jgi:hypothetical protein